MSLDYIARCPDCKRVVCAAVDTPERRDDIATDVGKWIRWGLIVDRMDTENIRKADWCHAKGCAFDPKQKKSLEAALAATEPQP